MMASPKISIVMPVLNRADTIEKAIRSVLDQQYAQLEFIIIDGGSTDGTVAIIQKYEPFLSYWHSKYDGSPSVAANFGIEKATGDLVVLFMADDWYLPEVFQQIAAAYNSYPTADIYTCGGKIVTQSSAGYQVKLSYQSANVLRLSFYNVCFAVSAICCRFIKKSLYQRIGVYMVYDDSGKHMFSNDKDFLLRAILDDAQDVFVEYDGHRYLAHRESSTFGGNRNNMMKLCVEHQQLADSYLRNPKVNFRRRLLMRYWYVDQSVRLFIFRVVDGKFSVAFKALWIDIKKYHGWWLLFAPCAVVQIVFKKIGRVILSSLRGALFATKQPRL